MIRSKPKLGLKAGAKPGEPGIQVPYILGKSKFGLGIFVQQDIPKGSLVWKYKRGVNVSSFKGPKEVRAFLSTLPSKKAKGLWLDYTYHLNGYLNDIKDDGVYWNHSSTNPTTQLNYPGKKDKNSGYAARDIKKGEEMFEDYGVYEWPQWLLDISEEFGSDMSYFDIKTPCSTKSSESGLK